MLFRSAPSQVVEAPGEVTLELGESYMIRVLKYDIQGLSKCELSTPGDEAQFAGGRITQVAKENYEKWATENQGEIARQVCALPIQISCLPTSATNDAHCS